MLSVHSDGLTCFLTKVIQVNCHYLLNNNFQTKTGAKRMENSQRIGFIGLGDMGAPMAAHMDEGGFSPIVYDKAGTSSRKSPRAIAANNVREVANKADLVFLSVPDGTAVLSVVKEIIATEKRNLRTVVNLSTVGIEATKTIVSLLSDVGLEYADAPISGGRSGAVKGSVTVMWSGSESLLEELRPLLKTFSESIFFVGTIPGQGQAMKLINNYLSAVAMTATSEAILFGLNKGLEMKTMLDVANVSTGQNSATRNKFPERILTESYDAGFRMALMEKDVITYLSEAKSAGTPLVLCEQVALYWKKGIAQYPDGDFTEIFKVIREQEA